MKSMELKLIDADAKLYRLYIYGKQFRKEFTFNEDMELIMEEDFDYTKNTYEKIKDITCADYPDKLLLFCLLNEPMHIGEISGFCVSKNAGQMEFEFTLFFPLPLLEVMLINPFMLLAHMKKELEKCGIIQKEITPWGTSLDEEGLCIDYTWITETGADIKEKCKLFCSAVNTALLKAEKEIVKNSGN